MAVVIVDGQEIEIEDGARLNGIQAAERAGVEIPHYCWHPGLSVVASCRMCLVETGRRDPESGDVQMLPKLVPACQTPANDQTVFVTDSEKVRHARAMVEEDLLLRHPVDCPICDKAGECRLQDYYFAYGTDRRRADIKPFHSRKRDLGPTVRLFVDRCVMCSRCVRFCREVAGTSELMISGRGAHEEIDVFPGVPLENKMSGNVVDLCPVGALGDRDFLYEQRVWYLRPHAHVCTGCATGCSIWVDQNQDRVYRVRPRPNPDVNGWWMCDEGRYGWKYVHDANRWTQPRFRAADGGDGKHERQSWDDAIVQLRERAEQAARPVLVLSPMLTLEDAYPALIYWSELPGDGRVVMGAIPASGNDEEFPGGFVIDREKCPNRRGVELLAEAVTGEPLTQWSDWLSQGSASQCDLLWLTGGYAEPVYGDDQLAALDPSVFLIVHSLGEPSLEARGDLLLPSVASMERAGSFVNRRGHLQCVSRAVRPPAGTRCEGHAFWQLAGRCGLYRADDVLSEIVRDVEQFKSLRLPVPATGAALELVPDTEGAAV